MTAPWKTLLALGLLAPGAAFALSVGDTAGTTEADVLAFLEAQGYTIVEAETEDGIIEVDATLDGQAYSIEVDPASGQVIAIEFDDGDDAVDEDDDDGDEGEGEDGDDDGEDDDDD
jgi:hypothetical protein